MNKLNKIRKQFSIFDQHPSLVYLDSAASTQTPQVVLDAMSEYYTKYRANIHRGLYQLSAEATQRYEEARGKVVKLINADADEIIFTNGTTHGLNHLAYALGPTLKPGDNIVLTRMEHHANIVPWLQMQKRFGFEIRYIELEKFEIQNSKFEGNSNNQLAKSYKLDLESARSLIDDKTRIVSFCHVSNTLGTINPAKEIIAFAKKVDAMTIVDAAQSVAHLSIDVKDLDCDFLVFSGHKMYGPTGIGVLYGKRERLEKFEPFFYGGDMISEVTYESASWAEIPARFEGGTPNIAGAIGLGAAVDFITNIGYDELSRHEANLTEYALESLHRIEELKIIGQDSIPSIVGRGEGRVSMRTGVISFTFTNIHPHDIAMILDEDNVAVRAGHHCTMPLMKYLGLNGTVRVSVGVYNEKEDVDRLLRGIQSVQEIFTPSSQSSPL